MENKRQINSDEVLVQLAAGLAAQTGRSFFSALVKNLAETLHVHGAWVTEYLQKEECLRAFAFWLGNGWVEHYKYYLAGTPCEVVVKNAKLVHVPDNVIALYPADKDLQNVKAVSYIGLPLKDTDGNVFGHIGVVDTKPMPEDENILAIFRIFAQRAAAELQRIRVEEQLRKREAKLSGLVESALDAILEVDLNKTVTLVNPAAQKLFGRNASQMLGNNFLQFLAGESRTKVQQLLQKLEERPAAEHSLWIGGGLTVLHEADEEVPVEATLSRFEVQGNFFYTLILRDVKERLNAELKIESLKNESDYLREEIRTIQNFDEIVGTSKQLLSVLKDVKEVSATDATVLILGETGTGKELIARAIHSASLRHDKALIKVNCSAVPASLMESEFFGHEKGAFTGATSKRQGRFELANGGTIFLDEIGEMPLDLQVKFLRVLQEGEFESVGSSMTKRVDLRVIAATHRNLQKEIEAGRFREDLYYRLNVFPIRIPPLRERPEDIPLLAASFAEKYGKKIRRTTHSLTSDDKRRLQVYDWPGNVRELQNIIERAVITSKDGRLNLDRALPETSGQLHAAAAFQVDSGAAIRTADQLLDLERSNIILALEKSKWKVSGKDGAAELLGMNPSTLASRIKTLRIKSDKS